MGAAYSGGSRRERAMRLYEFVNTYSVRGACMCGKCVDALENPGAHQPDGHTVDLTFFKVGLNGKPDAEQFRKLARPHIPIRETSYITLGAEVGDQGFALQLMGLGHLLGVWRALSPETMFGGLLDDKLKREMAGKGLVTFEPL